MRSKKYKRPIAERFWMHVTVRDDVNECWEWQSATTKKGYGYFTIKHGDGSLAHRFAYMLTHDDFDPALCVCHHCDNPRCCNPNHLWQGTIADNIRDKVQKNRQAKGEKNGMAKLKEADIARIKRLYADRAYNQMEIADLFGVSQPMISFIVNGINWRGNGTPQTTTTTEHTRALQAV